MQWKSVDSAEQDDTAAHHQDVLNQLEEEGSKGESVPSHTPPENWVKEEPNNRKSTGNLAEDSGGTTHRAAWLGAGLGPWLSSLHHFQVQKNSNFNVSQKQTSPSQSY